MSDINLKPCPFCGGHARILNYLDTLYYVTCHKCGAGIGKTFCSEREAIDAWNRRADK